MQWRSQNYEMRGGGVKYKLNQVFLQFSIINNTFNTGEMTMGDGRLNTAYYIMQVSVRINRVLNQPTHYVGTLHIFFTVKVVQSQEYIIL